MFLKRTTISILLYQQHLLGNAVLGWEPATLDMPVRVLLDAADVTAMAVVMHRLPPKHKVFATAFGTSAHVWYGYEGRLAHPLPSPLGVASCRMVGDQDGGHKAAPALPKRRPATI